MSDYATTKAQMINDCTDDDVKASIESNFTEEIYNNLVALTKLANESKDG